MFFYSSLMMWVLRKQDILIILYLNNQGFDVVLNVFCTVYKEKLKRFYLKFMDKEIDI